ncbi:DNA fragmentation factor subunit alpha [Erinaceus europaeus]|uniref:DNA fragmentation factor subunit alpha n=1 Tax=Erinaceus europaeus TaxID=9365 RepID=A0A1S3WS37_ERIEU|nr:DNA fragmentation factor subunit alpha [Erinaceus europaeus]XP_060026909.1 DNA fragmentation factor subunit alpha [Erinaceus europaeus]XP_060026910.1 DNA fragmentation factor subunit alpha [Erinaceus europaeus]
MEEAPQPGERRPGKPCVLLRNHRREQHGVAASCLEELRTKARDVLSIDESLAPVTLVLAEDGTIVDDDDYFLCLPSNTKFVALAGGEKWTYSDSDGGTAWISQESFEADETDSGAGQVWRNVARQLREDLSSIILLSEEDLQVLIDAPCTDLARELRRSCASVQGLQNTLQRVLDQREEARQSTQLLALYLQALEKEGSILSGQQESASSFSDEPDAGLGDGPSNTALASRVLATLQGKPVPELSLSSQDLELVTREDPQALATALNWDREKTETVQQACCQELSLRLQQIQSWRSLRDVSARKSPPPGELQNPKRAKPNPS